MTAQRFGIPEPTVTVHHVAVIAARADPGHPWEAGWRKTAGQVADAIELASFATREEAIAWGKEHSDWVRVVGTRPGDFQDV